MEEEVNKEGETIWEGLYLNRVLYDKEEKPNDEDYQRKKDLESQIKDTEPEFRQNETESGCQPTDQIVDGKPNGVGILNPNNNKGDENLCEQQILISSNVKEFTPDNVKQERSNKICFGLVSRSDPFHIKVIKITCALPFIPFVLIFYSIDYLFEQTKAFIKKIRRSFGNCKFAKLRTCLASCCLVIGVALQKCFNYTGTCILRFVLKPIAMFLLIICGGIGGCIHLISTAVYECMCYVCSLLGRCLCYICDRVSNIYTIFCEAIENCCSFFCEKFAYCYIFICNNIMECCEFICITICIDIIGNALFRLLSWIFEKIYNCLLIICSNIYRCIKYNYRAASKCVKQFCKYTCQKMKKICNFINKVCTFIWNTLKTILQAMYKNLFLPLGRCLNVIYTDCLKPIASWIGIILLSIKNVLVSFLTVIRELMKKIAIAIRNFAKEIYQSIRGMFK